MFLRALADPDSLAELDVAEGEADYEIMYSVGSKAWAAGKHGSEAGSEWFWAAVDADPLEEGELEALAAEIRYAPDIDLLWQEEDLESVVPALAKKFA